MLGLQESGRSELMDSLQRSVTHTVTHRTHKTTHRTESIQTDTHGDDNRAENDHIDSNDVGIDDEVVFQSEQDVLSVQVELQEQTGHTASRVAA